MKMNNVNLGEIISQLVAEKGWSKAEFARKIGQKRQNVDASVFKKKSLDTDLVCVISRVLDCNLFDYFKPSNANHYAALKATLKIEMGEQQQDKTFTFLFGENKVEIK